MKTRNRKNKWAVYGEFGGEFTNLKEARDCAKFASTTEEYDFNAKIWLHWWWLLVYWIWKR